METRIIECESCAATGEHGVPATTHSTNPDWSGYNLCQECANEYDSRVPIRDLTTLAERIYSVAHGHVDDKRFHAEKREEIEDWLRFGDLQEGTSIEEYAAEWLEYDAADALE